MPFKALKCSEISLFYGFLFGVTLTFDVGICWDSTYLCRGALSSFATSMMGSNPSNDVETGPTTASDFEDIDVGAASLAEQLSVCARCGKLK